MLTGLFVTLGLASVDLRANTRISYILKEDNSKYYIRTRLIAGF